MSSPYGGTTVSVLSGLSNNNSIDSLINGSLLRWQNNTVTFSFPCTTGSDYGWAETYNMRGFDANHQQSAVDALSSWSAVANLSFMLVSDNASTVGDIRFFDGFLEYGNTSAWGWSYYPSTSPIAGDIVIDIDMSSTWLKGSLNFMNLVHEIGHSLGLKHPGNYNAGGGGTVGPYLPSATDNNTWTVMSYNENPDYWYYDTLTSQYKTIHPDSPMIYDIQAIQYMYGANTTYHALDDTYVFDPNKAFVKTIWDAGGIDTFDFSAYSKTCTVSLVDGTNTSVGLGAHGTPDYYPDGFGFNSQTGTVLNTAYASNTIVPTGYTACLTVTSSNGYVSINGGGWSTSGTICPGWSLAAWVMSSTGYNTWTTNTININGTVGTFSVATNGTNSLTYLSGDVGPSWDVLVNGSSGAEYSIGTWAVPKDGNWWYWEIYGTNNWSGTSPASGGGWRSYNAAGSASTQYNVAFGTTAGVTRGFQVRWTGTQWQWQQVTNFSTCALSAVTNISVTYNGNMYPQVYTGGNANYSSWAYFNPYSWQQYCRPGTSPPYRNGW